jgi:peptide/nickel transport system substrate-binding protein
MKTRSTIWLVLSSLLVVSLILSACQTPTPEVITQPGETIVETVIITEIVEGTPVERIVTVVVTPEPAPEVTPAPIDRQGAWLDTITVVEEPSADAAVSRLEAGDIDIHAFQVTNPEVARAVEASAALRGIESFGSYSELTFNPVGPEFGAGDLNPFSVPRIREAMNWVIDRVYIAEEIHGGMAVPRWHAFNNASNDYAMLADVATALEIEYAYNPERGRQVITEEMEALGAELVNGAWQYNGAPVEIRILIRTEDERRDIGDYVGTVLEDLGFVVDRNYRTAAEASPIWFSGDPAEGLMHIYTGGWITTAVPRDLGDNFAYFYTDMGLATPLWQAYENDPEFYEIAERLDNNDFRTMEERRELLARALELAFQEGHRLWLIDRRAITPVRDEVVVGADLYGAVSGSSIWMNTLRRGNEVGGGMRISMPSILTEPWNAVSGTNWIFDTMLIRATGFLAYKTDPYTGLWWPYRFERAEVFIEEGLPVDQSLDWVTLTFEPQITVPDDAWVDWDAAEQRFITAGELAEYIEGLSEEEQEVYQNRYGTFLEDRRTASRNVVHYPADLFDTVTWHDGSPISVGDFVMNMAITMDRGKPESPYHDPAAESSLRSFLAAFRGVRIISQDPLVIETYTDNYQLDAERNVSTWWPNYFSGNAGWSAVAIGLRGEEQGLIAFSSAKATNLGVDRTSYIAGPTVQVLRDMLNGTDDIPGAAEEGWLPYAALEEFITEDEIQTRYANLQRWDSQRGHFWVGTGPFYLERAFPVEGTVILQRYVNYPDQAGRWDHFAAPMIPEVEVDGPSRVTLGQEATFDVFVTFEGEPYPDAEIAQVSYLVIDATGQLAHTGQAQAVGGGVYEVTLDSATTQALAAGSNQLQVIVVSNLVAMPVSDTVTFVTAQ